MLCAVVHMNQSMPSCSLICICTWPFLFLAFVTINTMVEKDVLTYSCTYFNIRWMYVHTSLKLTFWSTLKPNSCVPTKFTIIYFDCITTMFKVL